uniref:Putative secreted protein n=1 Tax=Ixodes ricinus TaxID=34613 RepID=A0A6B0U3Z7_IXORI
MLVFSLWNFIALSFVWLKDFGVVFGSGSNINVCFGSYLYAQLFGCGAYSRVLHFFFCHYGKHADLPNFYLAR